MSEPTGSQTRPTTRPHEQVTGGNALPVLRPAAGARQRWLPWLSFVSFNVVLAAVVSLVLLFQYIPSNILPPAVDGQPASQTIYAPRAISYASDVLTAAERQKARSDPANIVYNFNPSLIAAQSAALEAGIRTVGSIRNQPLSQAEKLVALTKLETVTLNTRQAEAILTLDDEQWRAAVVDSLRTFDIVMNGRRMVDERAVDEGRTSILTLSDRSLNDQQRAVEAALVSPYLKPNMLVDETTTTARRDAAEAMVEPVTVEIKAGQIVVGRGEIVTDLHLERLQRLGLTARAVDWRTVLATVGLVLVLLLVASTYLFLSHHELWQRRRPLALISLCIIAPIILAQFSSGHVLIPYLIPFASFSILLAVLLNRDVGIVYTIVISLLLGLLGNNNFELTVFYLISGMVGIYAAWRAERSSDFVRAGLVVAAVNYIVSILATNLSHTFDNTALIELAAVSALNGGMSAALSFAAFNLLGNLFGTTTPLQLLELAHPTQPLLRRLMYDAPGTYHHSLVVSNLAERAAEVVGADPLLARVGAYYHDIGKVLRPAYFIDNQSGIENIHDSLPAGESARVISSHVRDGAELAKKYRLPKRVRDIIAQHHGTTTIKFFYDKAVAEGDDNVDIRDYQYPGPRPQTKEAAIVMLADSVEAATRAAVQSGQLSRRVEGESGQFSSNFDEQQLGQIVHKVIAARLTEGQLDECDLTIRDIASIEGAFRAMLRGIYHPRIVYPDRKATNPTPVPAQTLDVPEVVTIEQAATLVPVDPIMLNGSNGNGNSSHDRDDGQPGKPGNGSRRQRNPFSRRRGKTESRL